MTTAPVMTSMILAVAGDGGDDEMVAPVRTSSPLGFAHINTHEMEW